MYTCDIHLLSLFELNSLTIVKLAEFRFIVKNHFPLDLNGMRILFEFEIHVAFVCIANLSEHIHHLTYWRRWILHFHASLGQNWPKYYNQKWKIRIHTLRSNLRRLNKLSYASFLLVFFLQRFGWKVDFLLLNKNWSLWNKCFYNVEMLWILLCVCVLPLKLRTMSWFVSFSSFHRTLSLSVPLSLSFPSLCLCFSSSIESLPENDMHEAYKLWWNLNRFFSCTKMLDCFYLINKMMFTFFLECFWMAWNWVRTNVWYKNVLRFTRKDHVNIFVYDICTLRVCYCCCGFFFLLWKYKKLMSTTRICSAGSFMIHRKHFAAYHYRQRFLWTSCFLCTPMCGKNIMFSFLHSTQQSRVLQSLTIMSLIQDTDLSISNST